MRKPLCRWYDYIGQKRHGKSKEGGGSSLHELLGIKIYFDMFFDRATYCRRTEYGVAFFLIGLAKRALFYDLFSSLYFIFEREIEQKGNQLYKII